jgi:hypothetical protein
MADALPTPKIPIPETNRLRDEMRQQSHDEGLTVIEDRRVRNDRRPLGVHFWVSRVQQRGVMADASMIRRRMNELADRRLWSVAPWVHLPVKFPESLPSMTYQTLSSLQSAYLPNPLLFPEYEDFCLRAVKKTDILEFLEWVHPTEEIALA